MHRMFTILVTVIAVIFCTFASAVADINTKPAPQFILTAKGVYDLGQNYSFIGKGVFFMADGLLQPWGYAQLQKNNVTLSGFNVVNYRGTHAYGVAAKVAIRLKTSPSNAFVNKGGYDRALPGNYWESVHEYHQIFYDRDFFYWGQMDYNFKFEHPSGHQFFAGVYWELSNTDATRLQIGPHLGIGDFEVILLLGEQSSAVRCNYTFFIK